MRKTMSSLLSSSSLLQQLLHVTARYKRAGIVTVLAPRQHNSIDSEISYSLVVLLLHYNMNKLMHLRTVMRALMTKYRMQYMAYHSHRADRIHDGTALPANFKSYPPIGTRAL